jgi:tungstate transport system substrate-binding protein
MHNDFVLVGPKNDPAFIQGSKSPQEAMSKIYGESALFVSRGDDSGTHKKELTYWQDIQISPSGEWYLESGQGMGATLQVASEKGAYTITDRATLLSLMDSLNLKILVEGHFTLLNIYHVMIVNPERWPAVNLEGARSLADFFVSESGQAIIEEFGVDMYGQPLFFPDAGKSEEEIR